MANQSKKTDIAPEVALQKAFGAYQTGDLKRAKELLADLLVEPAADGNIYLLGGIVEAQLLNWEPAASLLKKAVSKMPRQTDAWMALGNVLQNMGKAEEALPAYERVVEIDQDNYQALNNMGVVLEDMGRALDALKCYHGALKINPDFELALRGKAPLLGRLRRFDEACDAYEDLLKRYSDDHALCIDYAELLEQANQSEKAVASLPGNIDQNDKSSIARAAAIQANFMVRKDELENALICLHSAREQSKKDYLCFREGVILDRLGCYSEAMSAFEKANQAVRNDKKFLRISSERVTAYLDKKINTGIQISPAISKPPDESSKSPVFLVGLPRSGTTLLNRILGSHPNVQILEELEALRLTETAINSGALIDQAEKSYWEIVGQHVETRKNTLIIDKSPYHAMCLDVLTKIFSQSTVVFMLRHPYDSALSCFMQNFNPGPINAQFLDLESSGNICSQFLTLMDQFEQACPGRVIRIRYENLVSNFQDEVTTLLKALNLEWDDNINEYAKIASQAGLIMTASYEQVTRPLYDTAKYRWKNYSEWLNSFDETLAPLLERFGYSA